MKLIIDIQGRNSTVILEGNKFEFKTNYLKKMTVNDLFEYLKTKVYDEI